MNGSCLQNSNVHTKGNMTYVVYAQSCLLGQRKGGHLTLLEPLFHRGVIIEAPPVHRSLTCFGTFAVFSGCAVPSFLGRNV